MKKTISIDVDEAAKVEIDNLKKKLAKVERKAARLQDEVRELKTRQKAADSIIHMAHDFTQELDMVSY